MLSKNVAKLSGCNMGHAVAARLFLPRGVPSIRAKALSRTKISSAVPVAYFLDPLALGPVLRESVTTVPADCTVEKGGLDKSEGSIRTQYAFGEDQNCWAERSLRT